ncbi:hypothetical protein IT570_03400 [Candidatus Sumerlaeota bacterium]|nr:hypothetical protein [Candidatus Sumerlaeota bacterium]
MPAATIPDDEDFLEIAEQLDKGEREVTDWEADFLDSILRIYARENHSVRNKRQHCARCATATLTNKLET